MIAKLTLLLSLGVGVFLLVQIAMPLLAFKVWEVTIYKQNTSLVTPTIDSDDQDVLGISVEEVGNFPAIISSISREKKAPYAEFKLSIPKINLAEIKVEVDSNDFEQHLAHLPGSALPGEKGNTFITGHSSLIQFYRPDNFKAIFANLPKLKKGDEIELKVLGQTYHYKVESTIIVNPKNTSVVNPPDVRGRYLTLMTCVPPGFNTKRLVVLAKLK